MSKKYSETEKREAVAACVESGTFEGAAKATGIPSRTIQSWKKENPDWWSEVKAIVWDPFEKKMRDQMSQVVDLGAKCLLDRLKNGDIKINSEGEQYRVPLSDEDRMQAIRVLSTVHPLKVVDGMKSNE